MKHDIFNYHFENNLEVYFDNLELLAQRSYTHSMRWDSAMHLASMRNRNLDEAYYVTMWKDHSDRFIMMLQDILSRANNSPGEYRVVRPSVMNNEGSDC